MALFHECLLLSGGFIADKATNYSEGLIGSPGHFLGLGVDLRLTVFPGFFFGVR
jgi:hypothetical protein